MKPLTMDTQMVEGALRARLWDMPTRLVHWLIVGLIGVAWFAAETERMDLHRWAGYAVLGLVIFRLYWGVFGSQTARFASFIKGPKSTLAYAATLRQRTPSEVPGHNPLGAWSVVAILLLLAVQVTSGLFAVDVDGLESGPLSTYVNFDTGRLFAKWHRWSFTGLQVLVVVHVAAVIFYLAYKRQNLIGPMITGKRTFTADPRLRFAPWWSLWLGVIVATGLVWLVAKGFRF